MSSEDEGQIGAVFVFFFTSCKASFLFDEGVTDGTQKEGKTAFAFCIEYGQHWILEKTKNARIAYLLVLDGFPSFGSVI